MICLEGSTPVAMYKMHVLWRSAFQAHPPRIVYRALRTRLLKSCAFCSAFQALLLNFNPRNRVLSFRRISKHPYYFSVKTHRKTEYIFLISKKGVPLKRESAALLLRKGHFPKIFHRKFSF